MKPRYIKPGQQVLVTSGCYQGQGRPGIVDRMIDKTYVSVVMQDGYWTRVHASNLKLLGAK